MIPCADWDYCDKCNGAGEVEDANFYCSTCRGAGTVPARRSHYEVFSEPMTEYHDSCTEPPETGRAWGLYFAHNTHEARNMAIKDPEFEKWVDEARGDHCPPQKGLTARLARCEHGSCWACNGDEESSGCDDCDAEMAKCE